MNKDPRRSQSDSFSNSNRGPRRFQFDSSTKKPVKTEEQKIKDFLYKSKESKPEEAIAPPTEFDANSTVTVPPIDTPIEDAPTTEVSTETSMAMTQGDETTTTEKEVLEKHVLLSSTSSWKNKTLDEDSLVHLLTLEMLYTGFFSSQRSMKQADHTFQWFRDNHLFFLRQKVPMKIRTQVKTLMKTIMNQQDEIIADIAPFLIQWRWTRLSVLLQLILITTWYLIKNSSPEKIPVYLNNAINHAKWFGEKKDYAFINSILDKLITHHNLWANNRADA